VLGGVVMLGSGRNPFQVRVRQLEPFATLARWIAPSSSTLPVGGPFLGEFCPAPTVAPRPQGGP
jgi:hypothetical protein